jgi:hypothetical protein
MQSRGDGVGSESNRHKPSLTVLAVRRAFLYRMPLAEEKAYDLQARLCIEHFQPLLLVRLPSRGFASLKRERCRAAFARLPY